MEGLGINLGYLIVQIIAFIVIYTLLTRFLYDPLSNVLRNRRTRIEKALEDSAIAANARRDAESEAEKIKAEARAESARIVEESRGRGEELAKTVQAEAQKEADQIRADARTRGDQERDHQLADLRGQVVSIAVAMSQRLIGASLDQQRQDALISDFFAKVPDAAKSLTGHVEVVSAMPLTDAEKQTVQSGVGSSDLAYTVDPSILGGLVLRSEDRVVDGSVRSNLNELSGRLH